MISFTLLFSFNSISRANRFLKVSMVANQEHNKLQTYYNNITYRIHRVIPQS